MTCAADNMLARKVADACDDVKHLLAYCVGRIVQLRAMDALNETDPPGPRDGAAECSRGRELIAQEVMAELDLERYLHGYFATLRTRDPQALA